MLELNLPAPSKKLLNTIDDIGHNQTGSMFDRECILSIYPTKPCAECIYVGDEGPRTLLELGTLEYGNFFEEPIFINSPIISPIDKTPCSYPPHIDKVRTLALNFILETGGEDVRTVTYTPNYSNITSSMVDYKELTVNKSYVFEEQKWYCLDVSKFHSVENISRPRKFLSISFFGLTFDEFTVKYSQLIKQVL